MSVYDRLLSKSLERRHGRKYCKYLHTDCICIAPYKVPFIGYIIKWDSGQGGYRCRLKASSTRVVESLATWRGL